MELTESTISDFARKFLSKQGCPKGYTLRAYRKRDDRQVRADMLVKRRLVNASTVRKLGDKERVASLIEEANGMLSTNLKERGIYLRLLNDRDEFVDSGKGMKSIREEVEKAKAPDEIDAVALFLDEAGLGDMPMSDSRLVMQELHELLGKEFSPVMMKYLARKIRKKKDD